jgi:large subunit ribosomal protein L30
MVERDSMYAVVRIRGTVKIAPKIVTALEMLNLKRINNLSIFQEDEQSRKMIKPVQDYVAYGKITDAVLKELIEKKSLPLKAEEKVDHKKVFAEIKSGKSPKEAGIRNLFKMSPPRGGFERKGIKKPFKLGGASGDRKEKMDQLVLRMM